MVINLVALDNITEGKVVEHDYFIVLADDHMTMAIATSMVECEDNAAVGNVTEGSI